MKLNLSKKDEPSLLDVLKSVSASFLGVQSEANRQRDFTHGKASHFIVVGLIMTLFFILTIWGATLLILHFAGV